MDWAALLDACQQLTAPPGGRAKAGEQPVGASAQDALAAAALPSSAFQPFQIAAQGPPAQPGSGSELLQALEFWSQLYQIAHSGLKNALQHAQAAFPALNALHLPPPDTRAGSVAAALQLLQDAQSRNLGAAPPPQQQQQYSSQTMNPSSELSAATAALVNAAAGLVAPAAAARPAAAPIMAVSAPAYLPSSLLAGLLSLPGGKAAMAAAAGPSGLLSRDSSGGAAAAGDWSMDPGGASDGSHEHLQQAARKRPRREDGTPGNGKLCSNCQTNNTPFWRKDRHSGLPLCNACGLYAAKNDHPRPIKLWREGQPLPPGYTGSPTQLQQQQQAQQQAAQQQAQAARQQAQAQAAQQQQAQQAQATAPTPPTLQPAQGAALEGVPAGYECVVAAVAQPGLPQEQPPAAGPAAQPAQPASPVKAEQQPPSPPVQAAAATAAAVPPAPQPAPAKVAPPQQHAAPAASPAEPQQAAPAEEQELPPVPMQVEPPASAPVQGGSPTAPQ